MNPAIFWANVDKSGECWLWTRGVTRWGYGDTRFNGRHQNAHRVSWQLTRGAIPAGLVVCHSCDNRLCVNPDHLWLGTQRENMHDSWRKGRRDATCKGEGHWHHRKPESTPRGASHYKSKFTESDVRSIRDARASGVPLRTLACKYGVTPEAIDAIAKRKNWAHVV